MRSVFSLVMDDFSRGYLWWSETDLTMSYYHHLRPIIDATPYRLYSEWYVPFEKGKGKNKAGRIDLVVVDQTEFTDDTGEEEYIDKTESTVIIAMEFKFWGASEKDLKKLTRLMTDGSLDHKNWLTDDTLLLNKGGAPQHAFCFVIDVSTTTNDKKNSLEKYQQFKKAYPLVEIVYGYIPS